MMKLKLHMKILDTLYFYIGHQMGIYHMLSVCPSKPSNKLASNNNAVM